MILNIKSQLPPNVKLLANWVGWFQSQDGTKHRPGIYNSLDPAIIRAQVRSAHAVGIDGFVADWYGQDAEPINSASLLMANELQDQGMEFSIMLDAGEFKWNNVDLQTKLNLLMKGLHYVEDHFMVMPNYSQIAGKHLLWEFGWGDQGISPGVIQLANKDLLIMQQNKTDIGTTASFGWVDGFGSLLAPQVYVHSYLARTDPVMIPPLFDQFDDHNLKMPTQSVWGGPARKIASGQWQMCLDLINAAWKAGKRFPAVMIDTWNDYEEGTAIEAQAFKLIGFVP